MQTGTRVYEKITDPGRVIYAYPIRPESPAPGRGAPRYYYTDNTPADIRARYRAYGVWGSLSFDPPEDAGVVDELVAENWTHIFGVGRGDDNPEGMREKLIQQSVKPTEELWAAYEAVVASRAARYPNQRIWKTINEPGSPNVEWDMADHVRATAIMYRQAKAVNPDALVMTPEMPTSDRHRMAWVGGRASRCPAIRCTWWATSQGLDHGRVA